MQHGTVHILIPSSLSKAEQWLGLKIVAASITNLPNDWLNYASDFYIDTFLPIILRHFWLLNLKIIFFFLGRQLCRRAVNIAMVVLQSAR